MTKKELKQIYYINKELAMWQGELDKMELSSVILGQEINGMPHANTNSVSDPVAEHAIKVEEIKTIIKGLQAKLQLQRKNIISYIENLDDSLIRQIIFFRCVSCMTWGQVAQEVGGGNTAEGIRKIYNRSFEEK